MRLALVLGFLLAAPSTLAGQRMPQWVITPAAGRVLAAAWAESVTSRRERVLCLAGRILGDTVVVEGARLLPVGDADSLTAAGERAIAECASPSWFGIAHSHVRSTDDSIPTSRFSPGDRTVMSFWSQRWMRQGAFCVLYGESRANCELYPPDANERRRLDPGEIVPGP